MYISIYKQHLLHVSAFYSFPFVHQLVLYFKNQYYKFQHVIMACIYQYILYLKQLLCKTKIS